MIKRNKLSILLISIGLLLFTQAVIPYLHNHHAERHFKHGIVEGHGDSCIICSLDIVPAGFIVPSLFCFVVVVLTFGFRHSDVVPQYFFTLHVRQGRAPPVCSSFPSAGCLI